MSIELFKQICTVSEPTSPTLHCPFLLGAFLAFCLTGLAAAAEESELHDDQVEIGAALAQELGIETRPAGGGELNRTKLVYGKTVPDPQLLSHVTARYPGLIRSIVPRLGDKVEAGKVIAVIEANNSLQEYEILAPLSGTVIDKHANPGELASGQPLMTIANYENIWVDLTLFPGDFQYIRPGMPVTVETDYLTAESEIGYLNPSQGDSPTVIARVPLANPDGQWTPGQLVEGHVQIERDRAELVVSNSALQTFEGNTVVFVREGDHFTPRTVRLGRSDEEFSEVLEGLTAGEQYVFENSYLIKADLEKAGTEHQH